jgi:hypothetical protein
VAGGNYPPDVLPGTGKEGFALLQVVFALLQIRPLEVRRIVMEVVWTPIVEGPPGHPSVEVGGTLRIPKEGTVLGSEGVPLIETTLPGKVHN